MQYDVEINGRVRRVVVRRAGHRFTVTIDGQLREVDAARVDEQTWSLVVDVNPHDVTVARDARHGLVEVGVGASSFAVAVNGRRGHHRRQNAAVHEGAGPQRIVAPMPGKIVRVNIKTGEAVRARQPLVVIEAMKMENELRAGRAGTVTELYARDGASVDAGAVLVVIQ